MTITPQTNTTLAAIADIIRDSDDFVICGHISPDGDCIGCQLSLAHALWKMGKNATCILVRDEPTDAALAFMPGIDRMVPVSLYDGACDVFICVDVPNRVRIEAAACELLDHARTSITIDHHASETTMCDYVYVEPDVASASMLVWEVVKMLVDDPPLESAICAFVGIITDTGGLRFQNSNSQAFLTSADLVSRGVDPSIVATNIFQNRSMASLRLESLVIDRMQFASNGEAALSWIDASDLERVHATKADVEPLIDIVRSIAGVRIACMLREQDGIVRGNLRAKDDTDVSILARELGGGGHQAAAGFNLELPLADAVEFMKGKFEELLKSI